MSTYPGRIGFGEFARQLRTVFDAVNREEKQVLVEREGQLSRVENEHSHEEPDI